ncbi:Ribosomal protein L5 domain-containing protein [Dioscorea alata]|uniref:Ribosomal protein L5 domain-containing protein n=1 Tax=Dioscorea alata TaxID=55571 RepID=A0ACB7VJK6_DIOAL|nr:Ribosomal protein L5 domain-containing protein [Dioscorea alata]
MDKFFPCLHLRSRVQASNGKKKVVLRVQMENTEKRAKVMKCLVKWHGVISVSLEGKENNEIAIVGEGIDPVSITQKLRKKMGSVEMLKVAAPDTDKGKDKDKEKEADKNKPPWIYYPPLPQPIYSNSEPTCSIL